ncbi:MAG: hypothetical protein EPN22_01475 [Nitrospirae bacterium]|nr:MAG: hypothetical protein EPN22_01475 [Nitrospirota bacterium]
MPAVKQQTVGFDYQKNMAASLSEEIKGFLLHLKAAGRAKSTIDCYKHSLVQLAEIIGNLKMNEISARDLEYAVVRLAGLSDTVSIRSTAMNRIKSAYRSFFKWSAELGHIHSNPAVRLLLATVNSKPTVPITRQEIGILLNTIRKSEDTHALRDEALFATYAFTGIRRSEALSLKVCDYDPISALLFLPQTKRGYKRLQPVPARLAEILEVYIKNSCNAGSSDSLPMFSGRTPSIPLSNRQVQYRFMRWRKLAGIRKKLTIHSFRAGFAKQLYQNTNDLLLVSQVMGHRDISTTKRYVGPADVGRIKNALEILTSGLYI